MSDGTLPFVEKAMEYAWDDSQFLLPAIALELKRAAKKVKFPSQNAQRSTSEQQA
ncbi:hypothetical protein [Cyclobacterium salsum]|uniref:hypothetical protein n=1 Tax=Cyclobacterium salsum TaxID=2666329 RepID=UPI00139170C4|nr:hypothetical protein [Cyclobacterium salsum]